MCITNLNSGREHVGRGRYIQLANCRILDVEPGLGGAKREPHDQYYEQNKDDKAQKTCTEAFIVPPPLAFSVIAASFYSHCLIVETFFLLRFSFFFSVPLLVSKLVLVLKEVLLDRGE